MGMRLAQRANGVSVLHGQVSREMFAGLWPGFDTSEVPIGSITNGVHAPTWVASGRSPTSATSGSAAVGRRRGQLWEIRRQLRARLVTETRRRLRESWRQRGASGAELELDRRRARPGRPDHRLRPPGAVVQAADPDAARPERLTGLLLDPDRPVQIVIAGKAHPADEGGKRLIQQMVRFADTETVRHRIVFLPDYDMALAHYLVPGCRRLAEQPAAAARGLRHLRHEGSAQRRPEPVGPRRLVGRVVRRRQRLGDPDRRRRDRPGRRDELEASALYELLAKRSRRGSTTPSRDGVPGGWIEMVRHTLPQPRPEGAGRPHGARLRRHLYAPAAQSSARLAADGSARPRPRRLEERVREAWPAVRIEHVEADGAEPNLGAVLNVRVTAALGRLSASDVSVEVVYGHARRRRRDRRAVLPHAGARRLSARAADQVLRGGGTRPARTVRLHGPRAAQAPAARQPRRARPRHLPGRPAGMTNGDLR